MKSFVLSQRPRILVVALRRLGDVLFATPLIASLRRARPQAVIETLVFGDTAEILLGNPDIDRVIPMPPKGSVLEGAALALRLFARYDLAISTQSGDRPTFFALLAGRRAVGPVDAGRRGELRRRALWRSVPVAQGLHRLEEMLRLADVLGIPRVGAIVCPGAGSAGPPFDRLPPQRAGERYAVIHAAPMFAYKRWTRDGWRAIAAQLRDCGFAVIATGGSDPAERAYLDELWTGLPGVVRADGRLSWPQLTGLLRGAGVYIGPDTAVTHLAAASGCPTIALYGPTDPRLWGPVPVGGLAQMWTATGSIQRRGNVWLVQNPLTCLPCHQEGCDRNIHSRSRCLDGLPLTQVMRAIDAALAAGRREKTRFWLVPRNCSLGNKSGARRQRPVFMNWRWQTGRWPGGRSLKFGTHGGQISLSTIMGCHVGRG